MEYQVPQYYVEQHGCLAVPLVCKCNECVQGTIQGNSYLNVKENILSSCKKRFNLQRLHKNKSCYIGRLDTLE